MREVHVYPPDDSDVTRPPVGRNRAARAAAVRGEEIAGNVSLKKQVAELELLRSQWKITQKEQDLQKRARTGEAEQMAARVATLEEELADVATNAGAVRGTLSKQRNVWRAVAAATGVIALAFLCLVSWQLAHWPAESATQNPARPEPRTAATIVGQKKPPPGSELPRDPHAALSTAIDRLNDALATVPGRSAEEALRQVSGAGQGCMVVWNSDLPSVLYGRDTQRQNALANTLADCASAVSRLH
jgi:hypothetical protein